jgi:hypothetical protein
MQHAEFQILCKSVFPTFFLTITTMLWSSSSSSYKSLKYRNVSLQGSEGRKFCAFFPGFLPAFWTIHTLLVICIQNNFHGIILLQFLSPRGERRSIKS